MSSNFYMFKPIKNTKSIHLSQLKNCYNRLISLKLKKSDMYFNIIIFQNIHKDLKNDKTDITVLFSDVFYQDIFLSFHFFVFSFIDIL